MVSNLRWRQGIVGIGIVFTLAALSATVNSQQTISERMGVRHWSGQGISPVYEGFDKNPDGSVNLWFGYMNLNWEEELDVPIGPDNMFEGSAADRGQPTHFAIRRHKDVFRVVVPPDFGSQKLVWKLTVRGKTESITGTLNPVWQIDRRRTTRGGNDDAIDSNTPPVVSIQPVEQTVPVGGKATIALSATDDGLPRRVRTSFPAPNGAEVPPELYAVPPSSVPQRGAGPGGGGAEGRGRGAAPPEGTLSFEWFKYRGPGKVDFGPPRGIMTKGQPASTATSSVTFSEPGDYVLQAVVDDGSGESAGNFGYHCCWTNIEAKVHVVGGAR
jgi:hypothetical protein